MQQIIVPIMGRILGKYSSIENNLGLTSVLFYDISSISCKALSKPNWIYILIGFLAYSISLSTKRVVDFGVILGLSIILLIVYAIYSIRDKLKWDSIIIETRGGMYGKLWSAREVNSTVAAGGIFLYYSICATFDNWTKFLGV